MNKPAVILLALLLSYACKEVSFREPQPEGRRELASIPARLQGKYLPYQANGDLSKDTVIIHRRGYRFAYFDAIHSNHRKDYEEGLLSDSIILKSYRGYFFLNLYDDPEWILRIVKQEKNGDLTYMALEQDGVDFKDYVRKLSTEIAIDTVITHDDTLYHIDPTPAKLIELIQKGFVTRTSLKKIE
jgi:hypothetical protein